MSSIDPSTSDVGLSDGEVDFLWWFIQGSIMNAEVRARLRAHWGLCPRHSLAFLIVESAFRPHLIHGCTILYAELMRHAAHILNDEGLHSLVPSRIAKHRLRTSGPCHMCALGYSAASTGNAPQDRLQHGRDASAAIRFAAEARRGWLPYVCGRCTGRDSPMLCRSHLIEAMDTHGVGVASTQRESLRTISSHLDRFDNSFRWAQRDTDTPDDRGALIAAIGWCSGWAQLIAGLSLF